MCSFLWCAPYLERQSISLFARVFFKAYLFVIRLSFDRVNGKATAIILRSLNNY